MYGLGVYGIVPVVYQPSKLIFSDDNGVRSKPKNKDLALPLTPGVIKEKILTAALAFASIPVIYMIVMS